MIVEHISVVDRLFEFRDGPYVMSHVTQSELPTRLLRIVAASGRRGYGEIVRSPVLDPAPTASTPATGATPPAASRRRPTPAQRERALDVETIILYILARVTVRSGARQA